MKNFLMKAIPIWLVLILVFDAVLMTGVAQFYFMNKQFKKAVTELKETTKSPEEFVQILKEQVIPYSGYKTQLKWGDLGRQLVEAGVIDKEKYEELFASDADSKDHMKYLKGSWDENISINEQNSRFVVNTLWALGLVNMSKVLDDGPMRAKNVQTGNMASTGGWTLGSKVPMQLYSSKKIIDLSSEQEDLVRKIAENVYRPCCGNHTAFPDCNHGMAALGYIEMAVKSGLSEEQIYKDLLALNSYWFPQTYVEIAAYFDKAGTKWEKVDAKTILSSQYSSSQGASSIKQSLQDLPGFETKGGGCGA